MTKKAKARSRVSRDLGVPPVAVFDVADLQVAECNPRVIDDKETGPDVQSQGDPVQESTPAPPYVFTKSHGSAALVRNAGMKFDSIAEAAERLQIEDLAERIEKSPRLAKAWEKGCQLRAIYRLAATPICMEEASKRLGMGEDGLVKLSRRDPEVLDLWKRGKLDMVVKLKEGLMARACAGNGNALRTIEKILEGEFGAGGGPKAAAVDFTAMTPTQMEEATGIKRQQFGRWAKEHGMPRNGDGRTYSMPAVLAWLRQFEVEKLTRTAGKTGVDPLREQKARKAKVEADIAENRVVPIDVLTKTVLLRATVAKQLLSDDRAEEWASLHEGLTAAQLKVMYQEAFEAVLVEMCKKIDAGVTLPPAVEAKLAEAFELMKGTENA